ncbi:V-type proton ATPase subunit c'' [Hypoxylon texense]
MRNEVTSGVGVYSFGSQDRRIFLVDTPGFNDTRRSDVDVFKEIAFFLGQCHRNGVKLGGILYLHRITDNRASGSAVRGFELARDICGPESARFCLLVTTMWDSINSESPEMQAAIGREAQLQYTDKFWGTMQRWGSRTVRWGGNRHSAFSIVDILLATTDAHGPPVLQLQREMVDEDRLLDDTSAGRTLAKEYSVIWQSLREDLNGLKARYLEAQQARSDELTKQIYEERLHLEQRLYDIESAERDLRDDLKTLFSVKRREYERVLSETRHEEEEISLKLERDQDELRRIDGWLRKSARPRPRPQRAPETPDESPPAYSEFEPEADYELPADKIRLEERRQALLEEVEKGKKRKLLKRNAVGLLGILAGVAAVAAGGATMIVPLMTAGVGLIGTSATMLDFSRKRQRKGVLGDSAADDDP